MILTARDISQQLASRADAVARWLLPNGHLESGNWCAGSVGGEAGASLRVQISGANAGIWADFASGSEHRGDLLNLISAVRGVSLGEAIKAAKDWLGIRDPQVNGAGRKQYAACSPKGLAPINDESPVLTYLCDQRGIDVFTQEAFRIQQHNGPHGPEIAFPFYGADGQLKNVKYLPLKRDDRGKKLISQEKGCAQILFGWQAIAEAAREVVITEGEIDACTWHQIGFPALSIPGGAQNDTWIELEWDNLQRFDTIYLNWDADDEGRKHVKEFARRLGLHRCLILEIPGFKDANAALQANSSESLFHQAIAAAKPLDPQQIKTPPQAYDKVRDRFHPPDGKPPGFYPALFSGKLGLRPGEVTVWSGFAGHGKSVLLSQLMLEAMRVGFRVAIASMEMRIDRTLHRMILQAEKNKGIAPSQIQTCLDWMAGKLWLYDVMGNIPTKLLFELMEYSYARHGVQQFVIDSLMKCSVGQDDYDGQRVFLNSLCSFAEDTNTHVNLIAHSRKGSDEMIHPGKMDVLGSSSIINQASNILVVCRNKSKEEFVRDNPQADTRDHEPDAIIYCNKQREDGEEFTARLWHRRDFFRFERWTKPPGPQPSEQQLGILNSEPTPLDQEADASEMEMDYGNPVPEVA